MPVINELSARRMLQRLIDGCRQCRNRYNDNVALVVDKDHLTDEQVDDILVLLLTEHAGHE